MRAHRLISEVAAKQDFFPPPGSTPNRRSDYLARFGLTHLLVGGVEGDARTAFARRADLAVNLVLRHERSRAGYAWTFVSDEVLIPALCAELRAWRRTHLTKLSDALNALCELASEVARPGLLVALIGEWSRAARATRMGTVERSRLNEARGLDRMGSQPERGLRILQRVVATRRRLLGQDAPLTVESAVSLGRSLAAVGRFTPARVLLAGAAAARERALGPLHFHTLLARYESFAMMAREAPLAEGHVSPKAASVAGEIVLEDIVGVLGTSNVLYATAASTLGVCYVHFARSASDSEERDRNFARAGALFDAAKAARVRLGCAHGLNWLSLLGNQAWLQDEWHPESVEANLAGYGDVIGTYEAAGEGDPPSLLFGMGNIYLREERYAEAAVVYARIARVRTSLFGDGSSQRWEAELCVGLCWLLLGDLAAVEFIVVEAKARMESMDEDGRARVAACLFDLGEKAGVRGSVDLARTCLRCVARSEQGLYASPHPAAVTLATLAMILRDAGAADALETCAEALRLFRADDEPDLAEISALHIAFGLEG